MPVFEGGRTVEPRRGGDTDAAAVEAAPADESCRMSSVPVMVDSHQSLGRTAIVMAVHPPLKTRRECGVDAAHARIDVANPDTAAIDALLPK